MLASLRDLYSLSFGLSHHVLCTWNSSSGRVEVSLALARSEVVAFSLRSVGGWTSGKVNEASKLVKCRVCDCVIGK